MTDCPLAHSDAAYVLGALSPADRLEFERHLPGCERCSRSVAEFAGLPGLLSRVTREQVEAPHPFDPPPETLLPALVAAVRREQRRRTVLVSLGAAAAVAVVGLGAVALQGARDDGPTPQAAPTTSAPSTTAPTAAPMRAMDVLIDWGVRANVSLTDAQWGTKVGIDCSYASSEDDGGAGHAYRYNLVAFTRNGRSEQVASWVAQPGQTYADTVFTATKLGRITRLELQSAHGDPILRLKL